MSTPGIPNPSKVTQARERNMSPFAHQWSLETALEILQHPTVDSRLWAEAVEWLLIYGPPEIREMLQQASGHATQRSFPDLTVRGYAPDGSPCYDIAELSLALDISEEDARLRLQEMESKHGMRHGYDEDETSSLQ